MSCNHLFTQDFRDAREEESDTVQMNFRSIHSDEIYTNTMCYIMNYNFLKCVIFLWQTGEQEWELQKHVSAHQVEEEKMTSGAVNSYPLYNVVVNVKRKASYYMWNVALIMVCRLLHASSSFMFYVSQFFNGVHAAYYNSYSKTDIIKFLY